MVNAFSDIQDQTRLEFKGICTIYFEEISNSLIQFVNISNMTIQSYAEGPILQGFKILRRLVEKENKVSDYEVKPCYE